MGTNETNEVKPVVVFDVMGQLIRLDQIAHVHAYIPDNRKKYCTVTLVGGKTLTLEGDVSHSFAKKYREFVQVVTI